jgi:N6-L-threonylcarbamoyladenine synthase
MKGNTLDFSFSGLKTAVLRWVESHDMQDEILARRQSQSVTLEDWLRVTPPATLDLLASFQYTVIEELLRHAVASAQTIGARALIVSGGVACNSGLRASAAALRLPYPVYFPTAGLSTDNAAMIAAAAFPKYQRSEFSGFDLAARANLVLA